MKNYLLFLFPIALMGCGQAGPLYLPDAPPPIHVEPEKPEPAKTESKTSTETKPEAEKTK